MQKLILALLLAIGHMAVASNTIDLQINTGNPVRGGVLAEPGGGVIVGNLAGQVQAYDQQQKLRWQQTLAGAITTTPVKNNEQLLVLTSKGLYALSEADGRMLWHTELGNLGSEVLKSWDSYQPQPQLLGDALLVAFGWQLLAVNLADGSPRWQRELPAYAAGTPLIAGNKLWVPGENGELWLVAAGDGQLLQQDKPASAMIQGQPVPVDDTLLLVSRDGHIRAWQPAQRRTLWAVDHGSSWVVAAPLVDGGEAYVGSSDSFLLQRINAKTGKVRWALPSRQNVFRAPVKAQGRYWFATGDAYAPTEPGQLIGVGADGRKPQIIKLPAAALGQPVLVAGRLWVGAENGSVYAVKID